MSYKVRDIFNFIFIYKFDDGFKCAVDKDGIIGFIGITTNASNGSDHV